MEHSSTGNDCDNSGKGPCIGHEPAALALDAQVALSLSDPEKLHQG